MQRIPDFYELLAYMEQTRETAAKYRKLIMTSEMSFDETPEEKRQNIDMAINNMAIGFKLFMDYYYETVYPDQETEAYDIPKIPDDVPRRENGTYWFLN